jgi:HEAT repeat protein
VAAQIQELRSRVQRNPQDKEALNAMIAFLNGDWPFARTYACHTLGELGSLARPSVDDLLRALNSEDPYLEREAAIALGKVTVGTPDAVPALIEKLQQGGDDAGWFAAESLGKIGEPAMVSIPALEVAAQSTDKVMASSARKALDRLKHLHDATSDG